MARMSGQATCGECVRRGGLERGVGSESHFSAETVLREAGGHCFSTELVRSSLL